MANTDLTKTDKNKLNRAKHGQYKKELQKLEDQHGVLTPYIVVDAARAEDSPLHTWFNWNNDDAAEKYRLMQARMLMTNVKISLVEDEKVSAFVNVRVTVGESKVRGYISTDKVLDDEEMTKQILDQATRELDYWKEKYARYKELQGVVNSEKLQALRKRK